MKIYKVADSLPENVYLKIYSTFRSRISVYNVWKQEEERMTKENPQMNRGELLKLVNSKVASPNANMGGHDTGAAVDLSLCDKNGNDLVHVFDNYDEMEKEEIKQFINKITTR